MSFNRAIAPAALPATATLTAAMVGIGMDLAAPGAMDPNIEDVLLFASIEGMEAGDLRVLALLVRWFDVHAPFVNADRLIRLVSALRSTRVRALWSALARRPIADRRFQRLETLHRGPRVDLLAVGTDFHVKRHGEDPRFASTPLRVPANVLPIGTGDVLTPADLARRHRSYRCRVQMGPGYRADLWAALEKDPTLSATELARQTYASFASAWHVRRDFMILRS